MHIPVLLKEVIEMMNLKDGQVVVDATLGGGGHAEKILERIGTRGKIVAIDLDEKAIEENKNKFSDHKDQIYFVNDNFANLGKALEKIKIKKVDAILADLGWRMDQVEKAEYGISFRKEGPLDMRMNASSSHGVTAEKIINDWDEKELVEIFKKYGEEKHSGLAAKSIVIARKKKEIKTTSELSEILEKSLGRYYRNKKIHPATKVFQALRITVNQELENLEKFLPQALDDLKKGGYLAVIAFNSLEDRIVKKFFQANARGCICPKEFPICNCGQKPRLKIVTSKPVIPGEEELRNNPRSRSAKLRVIQKI
jgi:16S rRNA (cytosine1402-N4)-methyltransferase